MDWLRKTLLMAVTLFFVVIGGAALACAQYQVLHNFLSPPDGTGPEATMIFDGSGNLYGTTVAGGTSLSCGDIGCGTVFELSPNGSGWSETVLVSFDGTDGAFPASPVLFDSHGNLYGTTVNLGAHNAGTVFELAHSGSSWNPLTLYAFTGGSDGGNPYGGVIFDGSGNAYGTASTGGAYGQGVVYEINRSGIATESVLHSFGSGSDGETPYGTLAMDSSGNLYGTTWGGGADGYGTVFELSPNGSGGYTESVLHSFSGGSDGEYPYFAGVILDASGNLYGTTYEGGTYNGGIVFELTHNPGGGWTEHVLHTLGASGDGGSPESGLTFDASGNLYGSTNSGGSGNKGTVYELSPSGVSWSETILHSFSTLLDGQWPVGGVNLDGSGNVYGTAGTGGSENSGLAFEITP